MKRRIVLIACAVVLLSLGRSALVFGAEWCMPVDGASIDTPFGASCVGGVHRGVDLAAPASSPVRAPAAGRVLFAGPVPADGGGTCGAVTIEIAEGIRVSLLPLEALHVSVGDTVHAGEVVGRLAPTGDDSMSVPHLHMGLREGDAYRDPAPMLPVPAVPDSGSASCEQVSGATVPDVPSSSAPAVEAVHAGMSTGGPAVIIMGVQEASARARTDVASRSSSSVPIAPSAGEPVDATAGHTGSVVAGHVGPSARLIEDGGVRTASGAAGVTRQPRARRSTGAGSTHMSSVPGIPSAASTAVGCALALGVALLARSKALACVR
ncbi:murein hydrolase activator EnvC family protein [Anaerosoma tenue]|uniref:murein hydrolase activator EnvC family protein n=1 Tax=Anaerosoma tenue TaxID=2933588 RepID=UPI002260E7B0|nr:M23 family metallopeptidase [Anaerosoma tenue]MCK8115142.1 peptidoglycan DD-metalloendopeptidase family protein [Anaerosoma tenue]